jgi:hypothetical protein
MELGKSRGWAVWLWFAGFAILLTIFAWIAVYLSSWNTFWHPWGKHLVVVLILAFITVVVHLIMMKWSGSTATALSEPPPTAQPVSGVTPTEGALNVPAAANIIATFAEAMDRATITTSTFTLVRMNPDGTTTPVPAPTPGFDLTTNRASLDPGANLDQGVTYTATIVGGANGVKNLAGNPLAADKKWSFATVPAALTTPSPAVGGISSVTPTEGALNVPRASEMVVTFADVMDPATITTDTFFLVKQDTGARVSAAPPTYEPASKTATLRPNAELEAGAVYTATVMGGANGVKKPDGSTALAADKKWSFATVTATIPSPKVNSVKPTEEAKGVSVMSNVIIAFSEAMDPSTICRPSVLTLTRKGATVPVDAIVTYDSATKTATLNPNAELEAGAVYTVKVLGGADGPKTLAGKPLAKEETSSFTTPRNLGFWKFCIGQDGRGSVSKTQVLVWTYVFFFAVLWLILWQVGSFEELWANLQPEYLILLGSPAAAALLAKKFTSDHVEDQSVVQPPATEPPTLQTAATETITTNDGQADLFNFQYVLFNLLAIIFFFSHFLPKPEEGLPHLPETLVALTGLSAAGYAAKKGWETHGMPAISSVTPSMLLFGKDAQMTITGVNFGDPDKEYPQRNNVLLAGRLLSTVSYWDSGRIVATIPRNPAELGITIPAGAVSSSADLEVQDRFGRKSDKATVTVTLSTPTISVVDPVNGATSIALEADIKATFSEEMDEAAVEARGAFTLIKQGTTTQVEAIVTYDHASKTATLNPIPPLDAGATYTATVKGGVDGVKNRAGNSLTADRTWSFTTV